MYLRSVRSKTTEGMVESLQLCHNYRDKQTKCSKARVLYIYGREDRFSPDMIKRLIASLTRLLPEEERPEQPGAVPKS